MVGVVMLLAAGAVAQEAPDGLAGARVITVSGAVVAGGALAIAAPFAVKAFTTDRVMAKVVLGTVATLAVTTGAVVATPLLVGGTRRAVNAWAATGTDLTRTGLRFGTSGLLMSTLGAGLVVGGLVADKRDSDAGEALAAIGLGLVSVGLLVGAAGTVMQWTSFPSSTPLLGWQVPLGGARR